MKFSVGNKTKQRFKTTNVHTLLLQSYSHSSQQWHGINVDTICHLGMEPVNSEIRLCQGARELENSCITSTGQGSVLYQQWQSYESITLMESTDSEIQLLSSNNKFH